MAQIRLSNIVIAALLHARTLSDTQRKAIKKDVFAAMRAQHSIPSTIKTKVEIDDTNSPVYAIVRDKATGHALLTDDSGRFTGLDVPAATATVRLVQAYRFANVGALIDALDESDAETVDSAVTPGSITVEADGSVLIAAE